MSVGHVLPILPADDRDPSIATGGAGVRRHARLDRQYCWKRHDETLSVPAFQFPFHRDFRRVVDID